MLAKAFLYVQLEHEVSFGQFIMLTDGFFRFCSESLRCIKFRQ